jgi:hypothetical protein
MKIAVKRLTTDEKGQAMLLAFILLLISGLVAAPLLAHMGTGLLTGQVYETRTAELYAADAGVEDAIWKIENQVEEVKYLYCGDGNHSYSYPEPGDPPLQVNNKSVTVTITWVNNITNGATYLVESTATGDGSGTKVDAYLTATIMSADYSGLLENIATSQNETDIKKQVTLVYPEGHGVVENYTGDWPTPEVLEDFYWEDVKDETHYYSDTTIDPNGVDMNLGPLYVDGTLTIKNSGGTAATLTLTGTIYATGDTLIGTTGKDFTLNLNGHTIFVSSNTSGKQKALWLGGGGQANALTVKGPGAIIAVGDIYFEPKAQATTDPIFVLSVLGTTQLQPSANFYGALAGSVEVIVWPGHNPTVIYPQGGFGGSGLNFPNGAEFNRVCKIASWQGKPL